MCACTAPADALEVVQWTTGIVAAATTAGRVTVLESVVVPAVSVVLAAVNSVPVDQPRLQPPAHVAIVVVTFAEATVTTERVGIDTAPMLVLAAPVASVTMPGSITKWTGPPLFRLASLIASWM